jgi:hypothetical protein
MQHLNTETFLKVWFNPYTPISFDMEDWIKKSSQDVEGFWKRDLYERQQEVLPPSESSFGLSYNFYHDCILRHLKSHSIALSVVQENDYPDNWTYEKLHHCVNFHIDRWSSHNIQPKQVIAIVGTPNISLVIALLTAMRFGLTICYFPTNSPYLGKGQILKFLSEIHPQFIATDDPTFSIDGIPLLSINKKGFDEENHTPFSYAYPETCPLYLALSLQGQDSFEFNILDAESIYLQSLREGLLTFNLPQHYCWSMPLACPIRTEPFSTIMSLLCGVTRVIVSDDDIRKNPQIMQDEKIYLLGISTALQRLWSENPGLPTRSLKCCFKSPIDSHHQGWRTFAHFNKLEKIPAMDVLLDNSRGGVSLFSKPSLEPNIFLKPTLGTTWSLAHLNGSQENNLSGFGIFNTHLSSDQKDQNPANYTATHIENNLMLTGCIHPCREGVTYPIEEVEECISTLSFVEACMVHPIVKTGSTFNYTFVFLVFTNPMKPEFTKEDELVWTQEIRSKISFEIGQGFLPDKIDYFPLMPKMNLLGIDRNWCTHQYTSGLLLKKKHSPQYHTLGTLKKLTQEAMSCAHT